MKQRCCGLASIDDLKVDNPCDRQTAIRGHGLDTLRSCRDTVVVGKEHSWLIQDRCPYSLVYIATGLQKCSNVLLKQTRSESLV